MANFLSTFLRRSLGGGFADREGQYQIGYREAQVGGHVYFLPEYAAHRPAVKRMLRGDVYEPLTHELIRAIFAASKGSLVHAGAFFGDMLPSFSEAVDGQVWCFEPVTESYILANKCLAQNNLQNVTLMNAALSDTVGMVRMDTGAHRKGRHRGGASFVAPVGTPVPSLQIDLFDFDGLQAIHLDLEGHELPALIGATQTIAKHAPIVLIEDNNGECAPFLSNQGYRQLGETRELKLWVSARRSDHERIITEWLAGRQKRRR